MTDANRPIIDPGTGEIIGRSTLTPELMALMDCEKVIEQWVHGGLEVGLALKTIRDGRHYRAAGYKTFEAYANGRWGYTRRRAYQILDAAALLNELKMCTSVHILPVNEGSIRDLAPVVDIEPELAVEIWQDAVEIAQERRKPNDATAVVPTSREVKRAIAAKAETDDRLAPPKAAINKPDIGGVAHPARYSAELIPVFVELLIGARKIIDPFAGTGERLPELANQLKAEIIGIELEPEWANATTEHVQVGNALALNFPDSTFDAVVTSPTYGNRLADHHNASDPETRRSYTHDLGRQLHPENSGAMQWGDEYRSFHRQAWTEADRVLKPGGRFVLNIKDHIRAGTWQDVAGWHIATLTDLGFRVAAIRPVITGSLRQGENSEARVAAELAIRLDKP